MVYSQESLKTLSQRYNINPKTVSKWKKRTFAQDSPMGSQNPHSTVLKPEEEIAEVRTQEGKLYLFVAIDRTSKFVYVELLEKYSKMEAAQFLRNLIKIVP